jgi:hypothetical protein
MKQPLTVCSFYVDRREDYPKAVDYIPLLLALNHSCHRLGFEHVVLSDRHTMAQPNVRLTIKGSCIGGTDGGLVIGPRGGPLQFTTSGEWPADLPRKLSCALTEAQARHLESLAKWNPMETDILFVGADCLIARDFREHLQPADLSIILRPGHKRHRINNGFMYVPAGSVAKVAPLFRRIADATEPVFNLCHDMVAVERALSPMPLDYGLQERAGLTVNFLPMDIWNGGPKRVDDEAAEAFVLHFRGRHRKAIMLDWAKRWLPCSAS